MVLLAGIRVLDLSLQLPGPFCTMMMADYGADVIKVDEPRPRTRNPFSAAAGGTGAVERYLNRGKRSVTLNLKADAGKAIFRNLAATADVVVEGFRPGVVKRLGVDYGTLSAANPRLVYCSISGYGQTGPMRHVAGPDLHYIPSAGGPGARRPGGAPPPPPPPPPRGRGGGGAAGLAGAPVLPRAPGELVQGRWIDVSMTDGALSMLSLHAAATLAGEIDPARGDMMLTGMFPCYETYRCADGGYVSVGPLEAWFWKGFVEALGLPDLVGGQYATGEEGERVKRQLSKAFAGKTRDEWVREFEGKDVCLSPVLSIAEALSHPNTVGRGMVLSVPSPLGGTDRQPGMPIKIDGVAEAPRRAPLLGEHDDEVLAGLGYTEEQVAALRDSGVIRKREPERRGA